MRTIFSRTSTHLVLAGLAVIGLVAATAGTANAAPVPTPHLGKALDGYVTFGYGGGCCGPSYYPAYPAYYGGYAYPTYYPRYSYYPTYPAYGYGGYYPAYRPYYGPSLRVGVGFGGYWNRGGWGRGGWGGHRTHNYVGRRR
jgi:hypothetical protein